MLYTRITASLIQCNIIIHTVTLCFAISFTDSFIQDNMETHEGQSKMVICSHDI